MKGDVVYNDDFQVESGMWEKFTKKKENGLIKHFTYYGKKKNWMRKSLVEIYRGAEFFKQLALNCGCGVSGLNWTMLRKLSCQLL